MKRILSVVLSVIMAFSAMSVSFGAYASEQTRGGGLYDFMSQSSSDGNVLTAYFDHKLRNSADPTVLQNSKSVKYKGTYYYSDGYQLYNRMRVNIDNRDENVTLYYLADGKLGDTKIKNTLKNTMFNACDARISKTTTDGDYAYWNLYGFSVNDITYNKSGGKYCYRIKFKLYYNATKAQEEMVDKEVAKFVNSVDTKKLSDFDIMVKIRNYICDNAQYDYAAVNNSVTLQWSNRYAYAFSAYGIFCRGKAVCQGYALAFYRLTKELGFDCRFVSSDPSEGCHAWNIVKLDGKFYFVDCTWDDSSSYGDDLFLTTYKGIRYYDTSNDEHLLDPTYYNNSYFKTNYEKYFATDEYNPSASGVLSTATAYVSSKSYSYTGNNVTPGVTVKTSSQTLQKGTDYTVSYSNNKATGLASVKITGVGKYAGSSVVRNFYINPSVMSAPTEAATSASSITLKWSKPKSGCTGYWIYQYKNGAWTWIKTISNPSTLQYEVPKLSAATTYSFKIKPYKRVNRRNIAPGLSSGFIATTRPTGVTLSSLSTSKKSVTVKWKKVASSGYQVQYSTSSSMKNAKNTYTNKKTLSKKISSLKKGKKYYFRVRAYKTYKDASGKSRTRYGSWSSKKAITVK